MFQQASLNQNYEHPKCECHECTQARWRMYAGFGKASTLGPQGLQPLSSGLTGLGCADNSFVRDKIDKGTL
jgi:hypothetical protein